MGREDFKFSQLITCRGGEGGFLETIVKENGSRVYFRVEEDRDTEVSYMVFAVSQEYIDYVVYEFNKFRETRKKFTRSIE